MEIKKNLEQRKKEYSQAMTNTVIAKANYENASREEARLMGAVQALVALAAIEDRASQIQSEATE